MKDVADGKAKQVLELKVEKAKLKLDRARARAKTQQVQAEAEKRAKTTVWERETQRQKSAEAELQQCILIAPSNGFVVYNVTTSSRSGGAAALVAQGEPVQEGQKLLRIADLTKMVIATRVHETKISSVRVGQEAQVYIDAFPGKSLRGKVTQVSPVAAPSEWQLKDTKVYPVTIAIEDAPIGLKPSMTGEIHIVTGERKAVVQLPIKSIVGAGKDRVCFVKSGQELLERKVIIGASNATSVEITEGVKEGDLVVADPAALLKRP